LTNPIDDLPIPSKTNGQKTFEQLLEEELAREASATIASKSQEAVKKN